MTLIYYRSVIYTYGDLEMFLSGLELGDLIPVFQNNNITFQGFLKMTDHDLQQVYKNIYNGGALIDGHFQFGDTRDK